MFRLRSEAEGGASADVPDEVKTEFESKPAFKSFGGWIKFGADWDINEDREIIPRRFSIHEEWQREIHIFDRTRGIRDLPVR